MFLKSKLSRAKKARELRKDSNLQEVYSSDDCTVWRVAKEFEIKPGDLIGLEYDDPYLVFVYDNLSDLADFLGIDAETLEEA